MNQAACEIAFDVAKEHGNLVFGGISPTPTYAERKGDKSAVQAEVRKQCDILVRNNVDYLLAEVDTFNKFFFLSSN